MELNKAVRRRHMTRNFTDRPLPTGLVDELLVAALRAPSAGNTQGREFVVLEGPEQCRHYWAATTDEAWRSRSRRYAGLSRAPVVVLPFADPGAYVARYREADKARPGPEADKAGPAPEVEWVVPFWWVDAAFATMILLLSATDRDIGAALLGNFRGEEALRAGLGIPDHLVWLGAVLLGEPATPDPPSVSAGRPRRQLADSVHRGHW